MSELKTARVLFVDDTERIVPVKDIHFVGEEGAQEGIALDGDREVPIYHRSEPEWGNIWVEQLTLEEYKQRFPSVSKAELYNREIDERNRIIAENREKPWLPLYDGE